VGRIVTVVKDNGYGIDEVTQRRILKQPLKKFYIKNIQKQSTEQSSTSFGLYISKLLVECLGGNMNLKSVLGSGTAVTFDV